MRCLCTALNTIRRRRDRRTNSWSTNSWRWTRQSIDIWKVDNLDGVVGHGAAELGFQNPCSIVLLGQSTVQVTGRRIIHGEGALHLSHRSRAPAISGFQQQSLLPSTLVSVQHRRQAAKKATLSTAYIILFVMECWLQELRMHFTAVSSTITPSPIHHSTRCAAWLVRELALDRTAVSSKTSTSPRHNSTPCWRRSLVIIAFWSVFWVVPRPRR